MSLQLYCKHPMDNRLDKEYDSKKNRAHEDGEPDDKLESIQKLLSYLCKSIEYALNRYFMKIGSAL